MGSVFGPTPTFAFRADSPRFLGDESFASQRCGRFSDEMLEMLWFETATAWPFQNQLADLYHCRDLRSGVGTFPVPVERAVHDSLEPDNGGNGESVEYSAVLARTERYGPPV